MAKPTLHKELTPIYADYTDIVIDGPPRFHELAKSIILAADLVLIPVQPSPPDVWATAETVDLVNEARVFKETLKSAIAINRKNRKHCYWTRRARSSGDTEHAHPSIRHIPTRCFRRGFRRW